MYIDWMSALQAARRSSDGDIRADEEDRRRRIVTIAAKRNVLSEP